MDDLELRRRLFAEPQSKDPELVDAIHSTEANKQLSDELKIFDTKIASALKVDVPDNLANKLILKQSIQSHQQSKRRSKIHLAVAASVALIIGLGINVLRPTHTNLSEYSLAHYYHEANHFSNLATSNISLATINEGLNNLKVKFANKIGNLIAIEDCFYDGMDSMHLVFEGQYDNVTLFIIPKNQHLQFINKFSDENMHGISKQYSNADVIIIGDKREQLDLWQDKIDKNIEFSI